MKLMGRWAHGFTLIEVLVVILILMLLMGLLLPAVGSARHAARTAVDVHNLRQIGVAIHTYVVAWQGRLPRATCCWPGEDGSPGVAPWPDEDTDDVDSRDTLQYVLHEFVDHATYDRIWINPNAVCGLDDDGDTTYDQDQMVQSYVVYGYNYAMRQFGTWSHPEFGPTWFHDNFDNLDGGFAERSRPKDWWVRNSIRVNEKPPTDNYELPHYGAGRTVGINILMADGHVEFHRGRKRIKQRGRW